MTTSDVGIGVGNVYTTTYDYQGGFFHHGRREFRGFRYVRTNFPGGRAYAEQLFVQDRTLDVAPLTGAVERQATRRTSDNAVYSASLSWFDRSDAAVPIFHYPSRSETYLFDWTTTAPIEDLSATGAKRSLGTAYTLSFDANGFITAREARGLGDLSTSADDVYETTEIVNDPARWWVGRPRRVTARDAPNGGGARLSDSWFFYDGLGYGQIGLQGNLTSAERWSGLPGDGPGAVENRRVTLGADAYGHVTFRQDEEDHRVYIDYGAGEPTFTFPASSRVVTSESGTVIEHRGDYQYDMRFGKVVSATVTGGGTVSSEFDGFGRISKTWHSQDSAALPTTCYTYGLGYPRSILRYDREVSGQGAACGTSGMIERADFYDGRGRHVQTRVEGGTAFSPATNVISTKKYDAEGMLGTGFAAFSTTDPVTWYTEAPAGTLVTTFGYDELGRPTQMTPPGVPAIRTSYSDWTTTVVDAEGRKTESDRDPQGRIVERRTYTGSTEPYALYSRNTLEYDRRGHLRFVRDNANNPMEYRYNDLGELTTIVDPDGGTITREYYRDGLLKLTTDAAGRSVLYTYDSLHRPLRATRTDGQGTATTAFSYDEPLGGLFATGHLTSVSDSLTGYRQEFVYDSMGRPGITRYWTDVRPEPYEFTRTLDTLGRTVTLTYPDGPVPSRVRYVYGPDGQPTAVRNDFTGANIAFNVQYRPNGALERIDYANGVSHSRIFNPSTERVDRYQATVPETGRAVADWTYTYRPGGHLQSIVDAVGTGSETFGLDDMYRLTSASAPGSYGNLAFAYDPIGNMTAKEGVTFQYSDPVHPHRAMATSSGLSFDYDASGNIEAILDGQGQGRVFTYDVDGRIASVTDNVTGRQVFYTYDPSGDRIKVREVNGPEETSTLFLGGLYEEKAGVGKKYVYLAGTRVAEWRADGTKLFHTYNHLGSLSVVADESGADVQRIEYKPYGEISRVHSTTFATSFGYAGALQDGVSGLQDFGARSYDPLLGRFISIDPIISDPLDLNALNPYGYGLWNPVSYVDIGGYSAWSSILGMAAAFGSSFIPGCQLMCAAAIGGAVSGGVSVAENGGNLNDVLNGATTGAGIGAATGGIMQGARAAWAAHATQAAREAVEAEAAAIAAETAGSAAAGVSAQLSQFTQDQLSAIFAEYLRAPAALQLTAGAVAAITAGQEVQVVSPATPRVSAMSDQYVGDWSPSDHMYREISKANCTAESFCDWITVVGLHPTTEQFQAIAGGVAMWPFLVMPFGYSGGGPLALGVGGAARGAAEAVKVGGYTLTRTVAGKLAERPYLNSPLTLREIMAAGKPIPDPGGVAGALRWNVPGAFRGSAGTWELVVDPRSNTVLHWLFKSAPKAAP